jgi:protein required for attachment to host cells
MRRRRVWFLVADEGRARIIRRLGKSVGAAADLRELAVRAPHRRLREVMAGGRERPLRVIARERRVDACRSDPLAEDMSNFVDALIVLLESHRLAGEFDALVVVAPAQMLSLLHALAPPSLRSSIVAEADAVLTRTPLRELQDRLVGLLEGTGATR